MNNQDMSITKERERKLLERIHNTKLAISRLKEKRKKEIGALAYKHGLDHFSNSRLDKAFQQLAEKLQHEHK